jgi:hypothetical protein
VGELENLVPINEGFTENVRHGQYRCVAGQLITFLRGHADAKELNWLSIELHLDLESLASGTVCAPFWAYKLGKERGWIPTDPHEAVGICQSLSVIMNNPFNGHFLPWQIGNNLIAQPANTAANVWPPASQGPLPCVLVANLCPHRTSHQAQRDRSAFWSQRRQWLV